MGGYNRYIGMGMGGLIAAAAAMLNKNSINSSAGDGAPLNPRDPDPVPRRVHKSTGRRGRFGKRATRYWGRKLNGVR